MNPLGIHLEMLNSRLRQLEALAESNRLNLLRISRIVEALEDRIQEEDFLVPLRSVEQNSDSCV